MSATRALTYRRGRAADLRATFALSEQASEDTAARMGGGTGEPLSEEEIERRWLESRDLVEFIAAQAGRTWICEEAGRPVGYARVGRFEEMEELTRLAVIPSHRGLGIARALLERCWPDAPSPQLGRVVVAAGSPADLTLYLDFGVMPVTGHWQMTASTSTYQERRSHELDLTEPPLVALGAAHAVAEWTRLEPPAIGHHRLDLYEFFGRTRSCLGTMSAAGDRASALCWVGQHGEIGPAVGATPASLVPVILQTLDRMAMTREPDRLGIYCATDSWWLLRRLRSLGFRLERPSWVLSSIPLPGLDRYLPSWPALLL